MSELNGKDIEILRHYAQNGNRELYWNYLAQLPGNDGYGVLALGVVRNDNAPGAVANIYAATYAKDFNGRNLSEREWQVFGEGLMRRDLELRSDYFAQGKTERALNLPVADVQAVHDESFQRERISPDAWTPRQLLNAARRHGGEQEAEKIWSGMLDNSWLGVPRAGATSYQVVHKYADEQLDSAAYLGRMTLARGEAAVSRANTDPNTIGAESVYYNYNEKSDHWTFYSNTGMGMPLMRPVTDPAKVAELNDTRTLRLELRERATQFHPDDQFRNLPVKSSPRVLAGLENNEEQIVAQTNAKDPTHPDHPGHQMHEQIRDGVHKLDARYGRTPDETSDRVTASLYAQAKEEGLTRVDHVVFSGTGKQARPNENVFAVQGELDSPAMHRAMVNSQAAAATPVSESFQRAEQISQGLDRQPAMEQVQNRANQQVDNPGAPGTPQRTV